MQQLSSSNLYTSLLPTLTPRPPPNLEDSLIAYISFVLFESHFIRSLRRKKNRLSQCSDRVLFTLANKASFATVCLVSFFPLKKEKVCVTSPSFKNPVTGFSESNKLLH